MKNVTQLIVYGSLLALAGGGSVIETILSPAEECRLSAPCSFGDLWAPHGHEFDYGASPAITPEVAVVSGATAPPPTWGWEAATSLPPTYRYPWRPRPQPDDFANWGHVARMQAAQGAQIWAAIG
jgi:hypothetical protein